ncbi:hypothetical protein MD484_g3754, partial [Candolleomyces efflorescens]
MSTSTLPQELIDKIIDTAENDLQALKTFGLVGTQWAPRTRKHLLKVVRLGEQLNHPLDPITRCKQLVELLEANRELRSLPKTLLIRSSTTDIDAEDQGGDLGWIQVCSEDVIKVLHMLRRSVKAIYLSQGDTTMDFAHLSPALRDALRSFVARPGIVDFSLFRVDSMEMASMVQHRAMESLLIAFSSPPQTEMDDLLSQGQQLALNSSVVPSPSGGSSKKFLRTLTVCAAGYALYVLLSKSQNARAVLDFSRILRVTVGTAEWDEGMTMVWPYYLKGFCQNVQVYSVFHGPWRSTRSSAPGESTPPFDPVVFSFNLLPRLRYLNVEVPHFSLPFPQHNPIPHFLEALETLASSSKPVPLKRVTLDINFGLLTDVDDVTKALSEISTCQDIWARLDEILSREVFSSLASLAVDLLLVRQCRFDQSVEELDEMKSAMLSWMPNLGKQSKVKVTFYLP